MEEIRQSVSPQQRMRELMHHAENPLALGVVSEEMGQLRSVIARLYCE